MFFPVVVHHAVDVLEVELLTQELVDVFKVVGFHLATLSSVACICFGESLLGSSDNLTDDKGFRLLEALLHILKDCIKCVISLEKVKHLLLVLFRCIEKHVVQQNDRLVGQVWIHFHADILHHHRGYSRLIHHILPFQQRVSKFVVFLLNFEVVYESWRLDASCTLWKKSHDYNVQDGDKDQLIVVAFKTYQPIAEILDKLDFGLEST